MTDLLLFAAMLGAVAAFAVAFITQALTWYETACHPARRALEKSWLGWRLLFLKLFFFSFLTQAWLFVSYLPGFLPALRRPQEGFDPEAPPVLLLHGLYHNPAAWLLLRRRLVRAGYSNVHAARYETIFHGYDHARETALAAARRLLADHPGKPLILVGHSLGGVMVRECLLASDVRDRVGAAITLGAPHGGSKLATFGLGRTSGALMCGSEVLRRLNAVSVDNPPGAPCLSIFAPLDNMILPPDGCWLPGTSPLVDDPASRAIQARDWPDWRQEAAAFGNHISMLFNTDTHKRVIAFIESHVPLTSPAGKRAQGETV